MEKGFIDWTMANPLHLESYSQHFILFVNHERAQQARLFVLFKALQLNLMSCYSLMHPFIRHEENKVL